MPLKLMRLRVLRFKMHVVEGHSSKELSIDHNSKGPYINFTLLDAFTLTLWGHVSSCANSVTRTRPFVWINVASQSEIAYFGHYLEVRLTLFDWSLDQNIITLDISVDNVLSMQEVKSVKHLPHDDLKLVLSNVL